MMDKSAVVTPTTPLLGIKKLAELSGLALFLGFHAGRAKIQQIIINLENKTLSTGTRGDVWPYDNLPWSRKSILT